MSFLQINSHGEFSLLLSCPPQLPAPPDQHQQQRVRDTVHPVCTSFAGYFARFNIPRGVISVQDWGHEYRHSMLYHGNPVYLIVNQYLPGLPSHQTAAQFRNLPMEVQAAL